MALLSDDLRTPKDWQKAFFYACQHGLLHDVRQLCQESFRPISDLHANHDSGFLRACEHGHLDLVHFLSTSPSLLEAGHSFVDIHTLNEFPFHLACQNGHLDVVKFLTTSPELKAAGHTFVDIHIENDYALQLACSKGQLDVVKFLTTAPELLEAGHSFVDIHSNDDRGFLLACVHEYRPLLDWLIFDLKIELTPSILSILKTYPEFEVLFQSRNERDYFKDTLTSSYPSIFESPIHPSLRI